MLERENVVKSLGIGLLFAGVVGLLAGLGLFGTLIWDAFAVHEAHRQPLPLGTEIVTESITVQDQYLCQVGVRARIEAEAERRNPSDFAEEDGDYRLVFELPLRYTVTAVGGPEDGEVLAEQTTSLSGRNYNVSHSKSFVRREGGWIHGTFWFEKFSPPEGTDQLRVRLQLDPDTTNEPAVSDLELVVADDAKPIGVRLTWAIVTVVLGLLAIVGGGVALVFGTSSDLPKPPDGWDEPTTA